MAWSTWAIMGRQKRHQIDKFNQALAGASEAFWSTRSNGNDQWLQDNNTLWFQKMVKNPFFARFVDP